jgi:hypothetical protein
LSLEFIAGHFVATFAEHDFYTINIAQVNPPPPSYSDAVTKMQKKPETPPPVYSNRFQRQLPIDL